MKFECPLCDEVHEFKKTFSDARYKYYECSKCKGQFAEYNLNLLKYVEDLPAVVLQKDVTDNAGTKKRGLGDTGAWSLYKRCICQNLECGKEFISKRSDSKTCSTRCRVAAARAKNKPVLNNSLSFKEILLLHRLVDLVLKNIEFETTRLIQGR